MAEKKTHKKLKIKLKKGLVEKIKLQEEKKKPPTTTTPVNKTKLSSNRKPTTYKRDTNRTSTDKKPYKSSNKTTPGSTSIANDKSRSSKKQYGKSKSNRTRFYKKENLKKRQEEIQLLKMKDKLQSHQKRGEAVIPEEIEIGEFIKVSDMAKKMNLKASSLIKKLMELGVMATINDTIDAETAQIVAEEFECKVTVKSLKEGTIIKDSKDKAKDLKPRAPIVTVMGHVDHGKTKLLDAIRNSNVTAHESGGITQHIGAYKVKTKKGAITFVDTPGHAAFTAMRARGAEVTDIVVLVVAATEGPMPQTIEAINHARAANAPIIVALNKIDLPDANIEKAKQMLSEYDLIPEDWGGNTMFLPISALQNKGIDELLDAIVLQAEMMELKANPNKFAVGYVIESKMDIGKGALATIIIRAGQMKVGDYFVVGATMGKVRAMFDDKGNRISQALPSDPIEIMGFADLPAAGEKFNVVESDEFAREISNKRKVLKKLEDNQNIKKIHIQNAMDKLILPNLRELKVIIKADVNGSLEALKQTLVKLKNDELKVTIIHGGVGAVSESDVMLAAASVDTAETAVAIVAFRVRVDSVAKHKAESKGISIKRYSVIYEVVDYITNILNKITPPDVQETIIGTAKILRVIKISNVGKIAGCDVVEGFIRKNESIRLYRDEGQIWDGKISALKRFKEDVSEVQSGFECGISLVNYENMKKGDVIECYSSVTTERTFEVKIETEKPKEEVEEVKESTSE